MQEAVEKATDFLTKSGYHTYRLMSVKFDKSTKEWHVKFDVGALSIVYVTVTIDDVTGRAIGYERP